MSLLQKIRDWSGIKSVEVTDEQPIDLFEKANADWVGFQDQLKKAQDEFNETSFDLELKIEACNQLIEKGSSEAEYNVGVLQKRLDKISNEFLDRVTELTKAIDETKEQRDQLEEEILAKSIELTALLSEEERQQISDTVEVWMNTGMVKGEQVDNQLRIIVKAIDLVVMQDLEKGGEGSRGGKVIGHTKSGKAIYDTFDHIKHKDFTGDDHKDAANTHRPLHEMGMFSPGITEAKINERHSYNSRQIDAHLKKWYESQRKIEKGGVGSGITGHHTEHLKKLGDAVYSAKEDELEGAVGKFHEHTAKMGIAYSDSHKMLKEHGRTIQKSEEEIGELLGSFEKAESYEGHYANVICRNGDKILFLKRAKDKTIAPGQWCLPGGHIDAGESITQAGCRELKEEANIDCDANCLYVSSKAKCDNGKWSFYLNGCYQTTDSVALLDGESTNAQWMTKEQWMDADLFFDLKDHLIAMEYPEFNVDGIPTIKKAEEADFFFEQLEKAGSAAAFPIGTVHTWGGVKWQKISESKWKPLKKNHKLSIADVTAHAENTSSSQLKKVADSHPDPHLRDAAKREGERRKEDKAKKEQPNAAGAVKKDVEVATKPKKQKPVKYEPNEHLTDPGHKKIEKDFGKQLNKGFEFARGQYHAVNGNILNTDNARELADEYKKDRGLSAVVHEPASAFIRKLYSLMLKEPVPKDKHNKVLFSAGGTGAGKSTGMGEHVVTKKLADKAHIIYDANMNTFGSAVQKIDQALAAGKKVSILHTYRDPLDAFVEGAVPRSQRMEGDLGSGRTVPIGTHVNTHLGSIETIPKLKEHYSGNKNVQIRVIDNSRGRGNSAMVPIGFLKDKKFVAEDLKKQLNDHIDKMYGEGKISERLYRGFKTEGD